MALTRRQREVLDVIRTFIERRGYSPSLEEIGTELGLSSVATVHKHVSLLAEKGYLRRAWNQNRSIELTDADRGAPSRVPATITRMATRSSPSPRRWGVTAAMKTSRGLTRVPSTSIGSPDASWVKGGEARSRMTSGRPSANSKTTRSNPSCVATRTSVMLVMAAVASK